MIGYIRTDSKNSGTEIEIFDYVEGAIRNSFKGKVYKVYYNESDYKEDWRLKITLGKLKFIEEVDLEKYTEENNALELIREVQVSEKFLDKHIYEIAASDLLIYNMCKYQILSEDFISRHLDIIDFNRLNYTNVTEEFIDNNMWRLNCYGPLLRNMVFSEEFLDKHFDCFRNNLSTLVNKYYLSDEFIDKHPEVLCQIWIYNQEISYDVIQRHKNSVKWYFYYKNQKLDYKQMEECLRYLINHFNEEEGLCGYAIKKAMEHIYEYQNPPEDFYYRHKHIIDKRWIIPHMNEYSDTFLADNCDIFTGMDIFDIDENLAKRLLKLTVEQKIKYLKPKEDPVESMSDKEVRFYDELIKELSNGERNKFDISVGQWDTMSYMRLNEDFIENFIEYLNIDVIVQNQQLSEGFIREYRNLLNWDLIAQYQDLTEEFIKDFQYQLSEQLLRINTHLSTELKERFCEGDFYKKFNV